MDHSGSSPAPSWDFVYFVCGSAIGNWMHLSRDYPEDRNSRGAEVSDWMDSDGELVKISLAFTRRTFISVLGIIKSFC